MKILIALIISFNLFANTNVENVCTKVFTKASGISENEVNHLEYTDTFFSRAYNMFIRYNHPSIYHGHKSFLQGLKLLASDLNIKATTQSKEETLLLLDSLSKKIDSLKASPDESLFIYEGDSNLDMSFKEQKAALACLSVKSFFGCKKAVMYLLDEASIKTNETSNEFIFSDLFEEVLLKDKHRDILGLVANSLIKDAKLWLESGVIPRDDIFERVLRFSGSYDQTIKILGAYSIRGAAIYSDNLRTYLSDSKSGLSLLVISNFISYFDKIKFKYLKTSFSLPERFVSSRCLYGKPYHFWMASYMSYLASNDGEHSLKNSFMASHLLGVGYEMSKKTDDLFNGRASYYENIINAKSLNDINVQNAKTDIFFNTLGAAFGIRYQSKEAKNIDSAFKSMLLSGSVPKWYGRFNSHQIWYSIVSPNSHLESIYKL